MFLLRKPTKTQLQKLATAYQSKPFTYEEVGQTQSQPPLGYQVDHNRIQLGASRETFHQAKHAFQSWNMLRLQWLEPCWPEHSLEENALVGTLVRLFGVWVLNPCRVVYVIEETGSVEKFGFAYGTLAGHAETGEERFTIEWHHEDDSVWYDIFAFSKPGQVLTRLGYPLTRILQKRFAKDSMRAMKRACEEVPN